MTFVSYRPRIAHSRLIWRKQIGMAGSNALSTLAYSGLPILVYRNYHSFTVQPSKLDRNRTDWLVENRLPIGDRYSSGRRILVSSDCAMLLMLSVGITL